MHNNPSEKEIEKFISDIYSSNKINYRNQETSKLKEKAKNPPSPPKKG